MSRVHEQEDNDAPPFWRREDGPIRSVDRARSIRAEATSREGPGIEKARAGMSVAGLSNLEADIRFPMGNISGDENRRTLKNSRLLGPDALG
jgi:hypothetical protein